VDDALVSWAETDEEALEQARKWKGAQPPDHYTGDWHRPRAMYEHGEQEVGDEEFAQSIVAGSDPEAIADRLRELEQLGGTVVTLQNNSAGNAGRAIDVIGGDVLPALRGSRV
jgi:coenzyme F420-dependent glucose-6-phosphate dehydrogenase